VSASLAPPSLRRPRLFKDPASALTHFAGFLAALGGLAFLVASARGAIASVGMATYGGSLALLFLASSLYHFFDIGPHGNRWLRKLDHVCIFLLIAGTYVPVCLWLLDGAWRVGMLAVIGTISVLGSALKLWWVECPTWLSVGLYMMLGWIVIVPAHRILPQLDTTQLLWLVGGGLTYSLGAVVYATERPDPWPGVFGHHEVWHLFVLAGAAAHFGFTTTLLGRAVPL
jgi:hemolysin III